MLYVVYLQDAIFGDEVQNVVLWWVRCGEREFQIYTFVLETADVVNQAFPVGIKPFFVGLKRE